MQMIKKSMGALVAATLSIAAFSASAATDQWQRIEALKISPAQALSIATGEAPGHAVELELDLDRKSASYEIEVQGSSDRHKIEVDADSGDVLKNRIDKDYFKDQPRLEANIPLQDAITIAEEATQARVKEIELKRAKEQNAYYKVEALNATTKFKLKIDATDGKIIERKED